MTGPLRVILPVIWALSLVPMWRAGHVLHAGLPRIFEVGPGWFLLLLILAIISELKPIPYILGHVNKVEILTISIILLALYTFDWPSALLLGVCAVIVAEIASGKPYYKILFNVSMYAIATGAAGITYDAALYFLEASQVRLLPVWIHIIAQLAAGIVYYAANLTLLMFVLSKINRMRLSYMIVWGLRDSALMNFTLIALAIVMAQLWRLHPTAAVLLAPPLLMVKLGYQRYTQLRIEAESMLAALADVVDLRDDATGKHSLRVSEMSYGVARVLGLPEEEAKIIKAIGRVHDVGKVVIRDSVLLKPGKLTPHERAEIEAHVEAGGRILNHLSVYRPYLPIILGHHERLDGRGYPHRLKGDAIILGARILSVCDAYDTITSDRPHHSRQPHEVAIAELYNHAGPQFDQKVVEALETWLIGERILRPDWRTVSPTQEFGAASEQPVAQLDAGIPVMGSNGDSIDQNRVTGGQAQPTRVRPISSS